MENKPVTPAAPKITQAEIKLKDIVVKTNTRKFFNEKKLNELIDSVREKGVIQPILLRPLPDNKYELVCGGRRYRAGSAVMLENATRDTIPAVIRNLTNDEVVELQIIENLHREDIHFMEEAIGFKELMDFKKFGQEEIAKRIGKSISYVAQRVKLNDLIDDFQKAAYESRMNFTTALKIATFNAGDQKDLWKEEFKDEKGKIELDESMIQKYIGNLNDAPFNTKDVNLVKEMGACTGCMHNSAANTSLFPESLNDAKCNNSVCFRKKCDLSFAIELEKAKKDPTIEIVCDYRGKEDKTVKKLVEEGIKVLEEHATYREVFRPVPPDLAEFEEDLGEFSQYETREEMMKAYNKELEIFKKDIAKYEADNTKGKSIKAFVVTGDNKGKYIYITLIRNNNSATKQSAAAVKDGKATPSDIKLEIQRIEGNEKRKKELDGEKVMPLYYGLIEDDKKFISDIALLDVERRAMIVVLVEELHFEDDEYLFGLIGNKKLADDDDDLTQLYKYLETKKTVELNNYINVLTRLWLQGKLKPSVTDRPDGEGTSMALVDIVKTYHAKEANDIHNNMMSERGARELRVSKRILDLNEQLTGKKNPLEKKPDDKKAVAPGAKPTPSVKKPVKKAPIKKAVVKKASPKKVVKKAAPKKKSAKKVSKKK